MPISSSRSGLALRATALFAAVLIYVLDSTPASASPLTRLTDPTENAYTIELPSGWNNQLGLRRSHGEFQVPRQWATTTSPDGQTRWFIGDTNIPFFQNALPQQLLANTGMPMQQAKTYLTNYLRQRGIVVQPYQPAAAFARMYAQKRFGHEPGFRILDSRANPALKQAIDRQTRKLGAPPSQATTALLRFESTNGRGEVWISTGPVPNDPGMWNADASGFITSGNYAAASDLFARAAVSLDVNMNWVQAEQQRAAQRQRRQQQNATAQHQARMKARQDSFNRHQARMAGNAAAMDRHNQTWAAGQNSSYEQHQSFIRGINDQTLINSGGNAYEVDAGSNYYYVDELNNQYIGTEHSVDPSQLPQGYTEAEESWGNW